ncbi:MAG: electron transfer flavoprotein subunit alpha/FixB family protein, partial [Oscillibacter sp.]|nr:electron transfer flavoprotein subunit alpha/FixB family protein [Oscillibacter sp.]
MEKQAMILVYLETADGQILKVSLEALNAAKKLAVQTGKGVAAVLIGDASAAASAGVYGADEV